MSAGVSADAEVDTRLDANEGCDVDAVMNAGVRAVVYICWDVYDCLFAGPAGGEVD